MLHILLALSACGPVEERVRADDTADHPPPEPPPPLALCINEFVARNTTGWQDDAGAFADWIELHNPTTAPVSLDGWFLTDDPTDPFLGPLDPTRSIPPGGFLVVPADGVHLPFGLSADGEAVGLFRQDGVGEVVAYEAVEADFAWARIADCCDGDCFEQVWLGTPGASNTGRTP